ncbi:MAG TPA: two-component regulator propeller domain-containing protein [bacterium]|nr:two-component regulator propeller domain-containing protein [bacterium]
MKSLLSFICFVVLFCGIVNAGDFVLYDNPFCATGVSYPQVGTDGTLWFRAGPGGVVSFVPSTGEYKTYRVEAATWSIGLAIDTQGRVWVGSWNKVFCIAEDFVAWHEFPGNIGAIAAAPDGSVWCSLWGELWRFDGEIWRSVEGVPSFYAQQICFEQDGTGWFAVSRQGGRLARYRDGVWRVFDDLPLLDPTDMAVGGSGEVWITDMNLAHRFQDGVLVHSYMPDDGLAGYMPMFVDVGPDGRVWVGDYTSGVSMFDGESWTTFNTLNSGLESNVTMGVACAPDGTVFICTTQGIASYKNGLWTNFPGDTVMSNDVHSVAVDERSKVFYGCGQAEIGYYDAPNWEVLYRPEAYGVNAVYDIAFDGTGAIWFGQQGMLRKWQGTFINYSRAGSDGIPLSYCKALCCDYERRLWVCALNGLARYDGASWMSWPTESWGSPQAIALDELGKVWVSIPSGVAAFLGNSVVRWLPEYQNVTAMACAGRDALWLGFKDTGVSLVDFSGELARYTVDDGLPSNAINCIECDAQGNVWVGTADGLGYFDGHEWKMWDIDSGIPVNEIRDISIAPNGDVWFATPAGLLCRESGVKPPGPTITIGTDSEEYHAGDVMTVAISYENPGPDIDIDIQIACMLPDGTLFYYPGGDLPAPFMSGMLPSGTMMPTVLVLIYDFPEDFATGQYTWMTAIFEQGTFNMITDISSASFTFM